MAFFGNSQVQRDRRPLPSLCTPTPRAFLARSSVLFATPALAASEIASEAGVARSTIYVYFGTVRPFIERWSADHTHLREVTAHDLKDTLEPLRGSKAHVGALLDSVDSAVELVEQLTT